MLSQIVSSQNWLRTDNAGLSKSNFIETTDNRSLTFKTKIKKEAGSLRMFIAFWNSSVLQFLTVVDLKLFKFTL